METTAWVVDHLLEQPGSDRLGVAEAHPMRAHVLGVAAHVGNEEECPLGIHAMKPYSTPPRG
jgi:hypothetical protein